MGRPPFAKTQTPLENPANYLHIKIGSWNIENLGGGFHQLTQRDEPVINAIAETIKNLQCDICVVQEVMEEPRSRNSADSFTRDLATMASTTRNLRTKSEDDIFNRSLSFLEAKKKPAAALPLDEQKFDDSVQAETGKQELSCIVTKMNDPVEKWAFHPDIQYTAGEGYGIIYNRMRIKNIDDRGFITLDDNLRNPQLFIIETVDGAKFGLIAYHAPYTDNAARLRMFTELKQRIRSLHDDFDLPPDLPIIMTADLNTKDADEITKARELFSPKRAEVARKLLQLKNKASADDESASILFDNLDEASDIFTEFLAPLSSAAEFDDRPLATSLRRKKSDTIFSNTYDYNSLVAGDGSVVDQQIGDMAIGVTLDNLAEAHKQSDHLPIVTEYAIPKPKLQLELEQSLELQLEVEMHDEFQGEPSIAITKQKGLLGRRSSDERPPNSPSDEIQSVKKSKTPTPKDEHEPHFTFGRNNGA